MIRNSIVRVPGRVDIPFHGNEAREFERYLESRGAKKGPWLRQMILRELEKEKQGNIDGSGQARELAETIGRQG